MSPAATAFMAVAGGRRVPGKQGRRELVSRLSAAARAGTWQFSSDGIRHGHSAPGAQQRLLPHSSRSHWFNSGLIWNNPLGDLSLEAKADYFPARRSALLAFEPPAMRLVG
jgi:hypothetical protein